MEKNEKKTSKEKIPEERPKMIKPSKNNEL